MDAEENSIINLDEIIPPYQPKSEHRALESSLLAQASLTLRNGLFQQIQSHINNSVFNNHEKNETLQKIKNAQTSSTPDPLHIGVIDEAGQQTPWTLDSLLGIKLVRCVSRHNFTIDPLLTYIVSTTFYSRV